MFERGWQVSFHAVKVSALQYLGLVSGLGNWRLITGVNGRLEFFALGFSEAFMMVKTSSDLVDEWLESL